MGKGGGQTIGYKYFIGMQVAVCHGPIDKITRATIDDKLAWEGDSPGGSIVVNKPELMGGEDHEGGVAGTIDICMGSATQGKNSYLVQQLGSLIPAYRGVVSMVFRGGVPMGFAGALYNWVTGNPAIPTSVSNIFTASRAGDKSFYQGNNAYLKPWRFRGQRIFLRENGATQWYPEKAAIAVPGEESSTGAWPGWDFETWGIAEFNSRDASGGFYLHVPGDGSLGSADGGLIGDGSMFPPAGPLTQVAVRRVRLDTAGGYATDDNPAQPYIGDWHVYWDLGYINYFGETGHTAHVKIYCRHWTEPFPGRVLYDEVIGGGHPYVAAPLTIDWRDHRGVPAGLDMNPAHIIRECLTDTNWGMGYPEEDIDDDSFRAAADTLYNEGLGISLLWDKEMKLEEFIDEIKKHIDAAVYVSRKTGKYVLKLIRKDYNVADLLHLNPDNVARIDEPTRAAYGELVNSVTVNYWSMKTGKDASLTVTDTAMVQVQGAVISAPLQYPGFTHPRNATIAGQRDLKALSSPRLSCTVFAGSSARNLNVGDAFLLTWPKWGLFNVAMRATAVAYGDGRNTQVKIVCSQDDFDTNMVIQIDVPPNSWENPSRAPDPVDDQLIFEAPYFELVRALDESTVNDQLVSHPEGGYLVAAAGRPRGAITASLWTDSGLGYDRVGAFDFCPTAKLAANITKTATTFTVTDFVDIEEAAIGSIFQINNELLRIDAANVATGVITCGRGVLDTVPEPHVAEDVLFFWQDYVGFDQTPFTAGEEIDGKIRTASGAGVLPLAEAPIVTVTFDTRAARPYAPGDLRINAVSYLPNALYDSEVTISWAHRDRLQETGANPIDHTAGDIGPEAGTAYRFEGYIDDVLDTTVPDIAGTSTTWTPASSGLAKVKVFAVRDGLDSWQAPSHTFYYAGSARLTEVGEIRITEDGAIRLLEA